MDPLEPGDTLISRIGYQSHHFFSALHIGVAWLSEPVDTWPDIPAYQKLRNFAKNLPICNDATERMVKRTNDYANYGARSETDFQSTLAVATRAMRNIPSRKTKKDLIKEYTTK